MGRRAITDEAAFRRDWDTAESLSGLAAKYGVTENGIQKAGVRLGCPWRSWSRSVDNVDEAAFRRDWAAGLTYAELGAVYGVCSSTIARVSRRLRLPARQNPGNRTKAPRPVERPSPMALTGGEWVSNGRGVKVWKESA